MSGPHAAALDAALQKIDDAIRAALAEMGEDPTVVERYLASDMPDMRRKGLDRVRAAQGLIRRKALRDAMRAGGGA